MFMKHASTWRPITSYERLWNILDLSKFFKIRESRENMLGCVHQKCKIQIEIDPDFFKHAKILIFTNFKIFDIFWDFNFRLFKQKVWEIHKIWVFKMMLPRWRPRPIKLTHGSRGPIRDRVQIIDLKTLPYQLIWLAGQWISFWIIFLP